MLPYQFDKKVREELDSIRKQVNNLDITPGMKRRILNKCNKVELYSRRAGNQLKSGKYNHEAFNPMTQEDIAGLMEGKNAVLNALLCGKRVDLTMDIHGSQFHTAISQCRKELNRHYPELVLCDEWYRPGNGRRPYKQYWITKIETK